MGLRPATPGLVFTVIATVFLLVVFLSGVYIKSLYFLKSSVGADGTIFFGTLGYCLELSDTICSKPSFGYPLGQFLLFIHST